MYVVLTGLCTSLRRESTTLNSAWLGSGLVLLDPRCLLLLCLGSYHTQEQVLTTESLNHCNQYHIYASLQMPITIILTTQITETKYAIILIPS